MKKNILLLLLLFIILASCESDRKNKIKKANAKIEYITRRSDTVFCPLYSPKKNEKEIYPWEED